MLLNVCANYDAAWEIRYDLVCLEVSLKTKNGNRCLGLEQERNVDFEVHLSNQIFTQMPSMLNKKPLIYFSGSITSLAFSGKTHMLSASEDGTISIWECKSWDCVKTLKGHRSEISIACS